MRDQNGSVLWDSNRQLYVEELDKDQLVVQTRSLCKQVLTTAQMDRMTEQNQQLQKELEWLQFMHRQMQNVNRN